MPRWVWWTPVALLVVATALLGFRWGWIAATITETDVINAYAQRYLEDRARDGTGAGASVGDCVAYPGEERGVWLVVSCGPTPRDLSRHYAYYVNGIGQMVKGWGPHSEGMVPGSGGREPQT
ncbi:hypothetical protein [Cognatishimia sp. F0-27]|uniref:hypothetical protein n=1 Tax=Cognatishimia sp. F0-27 TaxID=2816855 RepID=UPI001D0C243E|nr:hypothetical protein [Cognatishimia sp. F0-27]MCC1492287.1 hypothetical protein [Cognatishimia sp. F0-27]